MSTAPETWTVLRLLEWTTDFLKRYDVPSPRLDAEILLAEAMGCDCAESAVEKVNGIFGDLNLEVPVASRADFELMKNSVNPDRLKNHPIALDINTIDALYHKILKGEPSEG